MAYSVIDCAEESLVQAPVETLTRGPERERACPHVVAARLQEERAKMARLEHEGVVRRRANRRNPSAHAGSQPVPAVLAGPGVLGHDHHGASPPHAGDHLLYEYSRGRPVPDRWAGGR